MIRKLGPPALLGVAAAIGVAGAWVFAGGAAPPAVAVSRTVHGRSVVVEERGSGSHIVILSRRHDVAALAEALAHRHRVITAPPAVAHTPTSQPGTAWLEGLEVPAAAIIVMEVPVAGVVLDDVARVTSRDLRFAVLDVGPSSLAPADADRLLDAALPHVWALSNRRGALWERFRAVGGSGAVQVSLLDDCEQGYTKACSMELAEFVDVLSAARPLSPTAAIIEDPMRSGGAGPAMVVVPNGQFHPGRTDDASDWRPAPSVRLSHRLAVARTETTVAAFRRFAAATGYKTASGCWYHTAQQEWLFDERATWARPVFPQTDDHPVTCVTYEDAQAYIRWIRAETGQAYRLPGEAEFEFFNRSGYRGPYGFDVTGAAPLCAWTNGADRTSSLPYASSCSDGFAATSPVGAFGRNAFGLSDTTGNVWELTAECWRNEYLRSGLALLGMGPRATPADRAACPSRHVVRGGSFISSPRNLRVVSRDIEGYRSSRVGFRLVRELR